MVKTVVVELDNEVSCLTLPSKAKKKAEEIINNGHGKVHPEDYFVLAYVERLSILNNKKPKFIYEGKEFNSLYDRDFEVVNPVFEVFEELYKLDVAIMKKELEEISKN